MAATALQHVLAVEFRAILGGRAVIELDVVPVGLVRSFQRQSHWWIFFIPPIEEQHIVVLTESARPEGVPVLRNEFLEEFGGTDPVYAVSLTSRHARGVCQARVRDASLGKLGLQTDQLNGSSTSRSGWRPLAIR